MLEPEAAVTAVLELLRVDFTNLDVWEMLREVVNEAHPEGSADCVPLAKQRLACERAEA